MHYGVCNYDHNAAKRGYPHVYSELCQGWVPILDDTAYPDPEEVADLRMKYAELFALAEDMYGDIDNEGLSSRDYLGDELEKYRV
jgi:hypothetical protein